MEKPSLAYLSQPFRSLSPGVFRASTIVFDSYEDFIGRKARQPDGYSYGLNGTPTNRELEARIAELEGAAHCVVVSSGQAALVASVLPFVKGGDHLLISDACYGGLKAFAHEWLARLGVEIGVYPADVGADIANVVKANTRMICIESPGTISMEMPDVPAIIEVARSHGILTMMDNTWASPLAFRPIERGIDLSVQAATKFIGGHSDLLMGMVSTSNFKLYEQLREAQATIGLAASADDCFLALRGLQTFRLRFAEQEKNTLEVAHWLEEHPVVDSVLFAPLESHSGHAVWKRDFEGSGCLLSFVLRPGPEEALAAFFNSLRTFSIGASWGGTHSLIAFYPASIQRARKFPPTDQPIIRISIGLESVEQLIDDLDQGLSQYSAHCNKVR
ncbi:cystathionine beta-lyase [Paraburkholderia sp. BCC1884]|uniref:cystathionine beta-lyase n=1 Tax=Paraburkholderia sp. BCC1884 TaxID=2562668 RepID=UPI001182BC9A|nr:cystathionine beta-lyase [Paraburkholderia sp. BCC1884]